MADVKLDYGALEQLQRHLTTALGTISMEFEQTAHLAAVCGDVSLGHKIVDFGNSWNHHRYQIRDELTWLRDSVKSIAEKFHETDDNLAKGLGHH